MNEIELKIMEILDEIEYGFKDKNDMNIIDNEEYWENEFGNFYYLLSPDELLEKKCGVCWDQVELERKLFEENNIELETYFMYIDDNRYLPSHTFLTYKNEDDKYCWFEHSWYDYKGIHKYNNLKDLLYDVKNKFLDSHKNEINGKFELKIHKYNKPNYNITCDEFYEFIRTQQLINIEEGDLNGK